MSRFQRPLRAPFAAFLLPPALASWVSTAEAADISGFVRDAGDGESLPFTTVYLEGQNRGDISNESGYYAIAGVPPGRYALVASIIGYKTETRDVEIADRDVVVELRLEKHAIEVEATVVEAKREMVESFDISPSRTTLQVRELKTAPAALSADPIRTIQTLPGVASLSDFSVGLYVRGGTPDQNLVLLDGSEVYNASHMFGLFSTFPVDAAKSTELLRGGYPAKYGGRLSSVLNVITDEGNKERFEVRGGADFLNSRLTLQGPAGRGSWLISGRRTHLEPLIAAARSAFDIEALGYRFYDLQGKTHQVLSHEDQVTLAGYTGQDNLHYRFEEFDFDLEWGNRTVSSRWTHVFDSSLFGNFLFTGSRFRASTLFHFEDVSLHESNRLTDLSFKGDINWFPSRAHKLELGILGKRQSTQYLFGESDRPWNDLDVTGYHHSAYVQDNWSVSERTTLQPGLRFGYFTNGGYSGWSPRLAGLYRLAPETSLKAAVGRYHQYIFRLTREVQGISLLSNIWVLADSTATPGSSTHYVAGLETRRFGVDLDGELYYKDYRGLYEINYEEQESIEIGEILRRGDGQAFGLDLLLRKRSGRHRGWLSLSLGVTERTIDGLNLDDAGREQAFRSKFDRRVTLNLIHSLRFRERWTLNTRAAYASGQPYTQILGRGELTVPSERRWVFQEKGPLNGARLPSYQRLDVSIARRFEFTGWGMTATFQVVNLTNHRNVFNYWWSEGSGHRRLAGRRREIAMLPLLPSIGIDFEF